SAHQWSSHRFEVIRRDRHWHRSDQGFTGLYLVTLGQNDVVVVIAAERKICRTTRVNHAWNAANALKETIGACPHGSLVRTGFVPNPNARCDYALRFESRVDCEQISKTG